jgi:hypothetical protein
LDAGHGLVSLAGLKQNTAAHRIVGASLLALQSARDRIAADKIFPY